MDGQRTEKGGNGNIYTNPNIHTYIQVTRASGPAPLHPIPRTCGRVRTRWRAGEGARAQTSYCQNATIILTALCEIWKNDREDDLKFWRWNNCTATQHAKICCIFCNFNIIGQNRNSKTIAKACICRSLPQNPVMKNMSQALKRNCTKVNIVTVGTLISMVQPSLEKMRCLS